MAKNISKLVQLIQAHDDNDLSAELIITVPSTNNQGCCHNNFQ